MRILHVIDSLEVGGAERMALEIANISAEDGHKIAICVTRSGTSLTSELDARVELIILNRQSRFDFRAICNFARLCSNYDLIHSHGRSTFSFLAFTKVLTQFKQPILMHDHYGRISIDSSIPIWFRYAGKYFLDKYVGVTPELAHWARNATIEEHKINTILNAFDLSRFKISQNINLHQRWNIPSHKLIGIVVGGIRYVKGIDILLDALSIVQQSKQLHILIVGGIRDSKYYEYCLAKQHALMLEDTVTFIGEQKQIPEIANSADFAIISSRSESGPLVLIEYMAASLPFIATHVGGITEQVAKLGMSGIVSAANHEALANEIDKLVALDDKERIKRGKQSLKIVEKYFNIRHVIDQWYALYRDIVID